MTFKVPKWNRRVTVLDVPRLMPMVFPEFTKRDHEAIAYYNGRQANAMHDAWVAGAEAALDRYGAHGALISGVVRDHFPEHVKQRLREQAHTASYQISIAWAHWRAAGKRIAFPLSRGRYGA